MLDVSVKLSTPGLVLNRGFAKAMPRDFLFIYQIVTISKKMEVKSLSHINLLHQLST